MIKEYLKLLRINHWIKNVFVFVPLVFSKNLTNYDLVRENLFAFLTFCVASSFVYVINDIFDVERDRAHPTKRLRPLANGTIKRSSAFYLLIILAAILTFSFYHFRLNFVLVVATYILINFLYSIKLKEIVIVDIMLIAAGFMLRVIGGAYVIDVYISSWLILTTLFISLFLGVMKRKSESDLYEMEGDTRVVLRDYSPGFMNQISAISAAGVIICYALYSVSERTVEFFGSENIVFTTIFVIFGIFRYMFLVYTGQKGENAFELMIRDVPMVVNVVLYSVTLIIIIY